MKKEVIKIAAESKRRNSTCNDFRKIAKVKKK
jgi:hypothetical protein